MTYYTRFPEPRKVAHDDCLPDEQFDTIELSGGHEHRHQKAPWCWAPIYTMEPDKFTCHYCGEAVR